MAVSFSSFVGFSSTLNHPHASRTGWTSILKCQDLKSSYGIHWVVSPIKGSKVGICKVVPNGDTVVTDTSSTDVQHAENSYSSDGAFAATSSTLESSNLDQIHSEERDISGTQFSEVSENSKASGKSNLDDPAANKKPVLKRSPLTAREKVRAARVLSRYTESKAAKPAMGSKLIDALKEADKGKRTSGLPEAPTNLFDDSKRGMPKAGWTFDFPGGVDMFFIAFSFVFISTVMFATTYLVWKVGAIHFNEY